MIEIGDVVKIRNFNRDLFGTVIGIEYGGSVAAKDILVLRVKNTKIEGTFYNEFTLRSYVDQAVRMSKEEAVLYKLENA